MSHSSRPFIIKSSRFVLAGFALLVMVTQFNNCGGYSASTDLSGASAVSCTNDKCYESNSNSLNVTPHLGNGEYAVPANLAEFNIGGDCNEAGFPNNYIHWDLIDQSGAIVRHSGMQIAPGYTAEQKCINGRFFIYVVLTPLTINNADPYNRTGLMTPAGVRAAYNLHITIFASDPATGEQGQYQANVPLSAI